MTLDQMSEQQIIAAAKRILRARVEKHYTTAYNEVRELTCPGDAAEFVATYVADKLYENFGVVYLSTRHRVQAVKIHFTGTLDACNVYPRVVVAEALKRHAAAVVLFHNHPSGNPDPSSADQAITRHIVEACSLVDVRVLDHLIVGAGHVSSMAGLGMM